jgi:hypothetical protein
MWTMPHNMWTMAERRARVGTVWTVALLDEVAGLGPFFAVDSHPADSAVTEPWRSMRELVDGSDVLLGRVLAVRERLAAGGGLPPESIEVRVAASVAHLGVVSRLVSPALAMAVLGGVVPDLALTDTRWQPVLGGPVPLSIRVPLPPWAGELPALLADQVLDGPVRELGEAFERLSVSGQVLWGNVASAVNGATTMIVKARPDHATQARTLTSALLARPPLRGTSTIIQGRFRRRSCCLIYRAAPNAAGPVCGDCVLVSR